MRPRREAVPETPARPSPRGRAGSGGAPTPPGSRQIRPEGHRPSPTGTDPAPSADTRNSRPPSAGRSVSYEKVEYSSGHRTSPCRAAPGCPTRPRRRPGTKLPRAFTANVPHGKPESCRGRDPTIHQTAARGSHRHARDHQHAAQAPSRRRRDPVPRGRSPDRPAVRDDLPRPGPVRRGHACELTGAPAAPARGPVRGPPPSARRYRPTGLPASSVTQRVQPLVVDPKWCAISWTQKFS